MERAAKTNNKKSKLARGKMLEPFFIISFYFLCPDVKHSGLFEIIQNLEFQKQSQKATVAYNIFSD